MGVCVFSGFERRATWELTPLPLPILVVGPQGSPLIEGTTSHVEADPGLLGQGPPFLCLEFLPWRLPPVSSPGCNEGWPCPGMWTGRALELRGHCTLFFRVPLPAAFLGFFCQRPLGTVPSDRPASSAQGAAEGVSRRCVVGGSVRVETCAVCVVAGSGAPGGVCSPIGNTFLIWGTGTDGRYSDSLSGLLG